MADDSDEVIKPKVFEAAAPPHGMTDYDLAALTPHQQILLNRVKTDTAREDWMYLARHPQVHAVVALLLRGFFRDHPRCAHKYAANFVLRPEFRAEVDDYLIRNPAPPPPPGPITAEEEEGSEEPEVVESTVVIEDEGVDEDLYKWIQDLILSGLMDHIGEDEEGLEGLTESEILRRRGLLSEDALRLLRRFPGSSLDAMESLDVIGLQPPPVMDDNIIKERLQRISEEVDNELSNESCQDLSENKDYDQLVEKSRQDISENEDDDRPVKERLQDVSENADDDQLVEERLQDVSENGDKRLPDVSENLEDSPSEMQNTP